MSRTWNSLQFSAGVKNKQTIPCIAVGTVLVVVAIQQNQFCMGRPVITRYAILSIADIHYSEQAGMVQRAH